MASHMQNPAGQGGACEGTQLDKRDAKQDTATQPHQQDHVVGAIERNKREKVRVTLKSFSDLRQIDIRIFKNVHGVEVGTPQGCTVKATRLRSLIEILERAEDAAKAEGLIT